MKLFFYFVYRLLFCNKIHVCEYDSLYVCLTLNGYKIGVFRSSKIHF